jgi:hypothetical protein
MTDLYTRIVSQRHGLEKIVSKIPGFRGYAEMNARREADRQIRNHIVGLQKQEMQRLIAVERKKVGAGDLGFAMRTKSLKTQFQVLIDKVNTAMPGYSGFYAAIKVGPEELEKIYAFDVAQLQYVDDIRDGITALESATTDADAVEKGVVHLEAVVAEAANAFGLRDNVVLGIR